jgi:N-acetylglutamate synthase-like GNAT family acetyltransferase
MNIETIYHINNAGDWSTMWIMEKEGKAFIRIYWYHDDKDSAYIDSLSVDLDEREQGIGKSLLHKCEEIIINNDFERIYLCVEKILDARLV